MSFYEPVWCAKREEHTLNHEDYTYIGYSYESPAPVFVRVERSCATCMTTHQQGRGEQHEP